MYYVAESLGFVRTLMPIKDEVESSDIYVGTTKNFILEGSMYDKIKPLIQVSLWSLRV